MKNIQKLSNCECYIHALTTQYIVLYLFGYLEILGAEGAYPMEVLLMSKVCDFCGKHAVAGRSISHSHRTVARTFKPNIQRVTVVVDGQRKKMNVCSRCLKSGKIARN
jgi:ribosomal protein L28